MWAKHILEFRNVENAYHSTLCLNALQKKANCRGGYIFLKEIAASHNQMLLNLTQ